MNNIPSKAEVMGWNSQSLADFMRKLKLTGCDRVVTKASITGEQFIHMTEGELDVFPCLYIPIITKIQSEINKEEQKKAFANKFKVLKPPKPVIFKKEESWDSDEFENESENEYEGPDQDETEEDYICALSDSQTAEEQLSDEACESANKVPDIEHIRKPPRPPRPARLQDNCRAERSMKLPHLPRMSIAPQRPVIAPRGRTVEAPGSFTSKHKHPLPPRPTDMPNSRPDKPCPAPPIPTPPAKVSNSTERPKMTLDPSWYGGKVTRQQAEAAIRLVNKDGAFLVRDSLKNPIEHPYTLVLLNQGRIYNIKIRNQGNSYSLGNGLKNSQSFPGVKEMISHHAHTPLMLIDATDQSPEEQHQPKCCLLHPVRP
ncbi:lymphocyte cytosolic protein 2 [Mugil cephalus]|uniref:lymphocyte cytosolic protein 2 n=1 Tax=Mugil cephalus TaxID=48193 RepID=UPI001FB803CA|nr:lymphocyte cytosolic protein 2 [Mugil cephalus]